MDEEMKAQPEEIVKEQPKAGFLEKLKPHKFKILGGVLGVLVFTGALFGAYKIIQRQAQPTPQPTPTPVVTSTPDPTTDWVAHASSLFSVKYPPTWLIKETASDFFVFLPSASTPPNSAPISLDARLEKTYGQSVRDHKENLVEPKIENITIAGRPATKISGKVGPGFGEGTFVISIVIDYQGSAISFDYSWDEEGIYQQAFNLMLSTFRFLEEESCAGMSLSEAKEIALESECIEEGSLSDEYFCNESTSTWWIDLDIQKEGCAPACVINASTGEAEINWRCTGLITP